MLKRKEIIQPFELSSCNDPICRICYDNGIEYTKEHHKAWEKEFSAQTDRKIDAYKEIKSIANQLLKMQLGSA